jgi:hypothetical protein
MSRYGSVFNRKQGGSDWLFLTTENRDQLAPLLNSYGQQVDRAKPGSATGPYNHPLRVYLIDGQKRIRNIYGYGLLDPRLVMTDVRTLLMEAAQLKAAPRTQTPPQTSAQPPANQATFALQSSVRKAVSRKPSHDVQIDCAHGMKQTAFFQKKGLVIQSEKVHLAFVGCGLRRRGMDFT